uniref:NADH dehydrogenase subunit 6 n=1 Tax=Proasellus arthrodilus TaxID=1281940 RepID=A0A485M896_9CRUS|nr:NADH dehydrogenase subunit 6 [Proasellus arthrodilus]
MNSLSALLIFLGGMFVASNTPHMLISSLLTSTLLVVIVLGLLNSFPWLAYILFLIFLGGILILFTYISSLSTNHLFSEVKLSVVVMFFILASMLLLNKTPSVTEGWASISCDTNMFMKELFTPTFYPLYLYLFVYLLITLLYVVMIMKVYYAPLRSSSL